MMNYLFLRAQKCAGMGLRSLHLHFLRKIFFVINSVWQKGILLINNSKFLVLSNIGNSEWIMKHSGFSLVEMLMALLVASLLLAALAPVMTKRFGENVNVSGTGGSGVKSDYSRVFDKDTEWTVPSGVNTINITAVGGGGAGGGAGYGYKEITSNESNWTVPDNVTKIRVFMTGAGGGGASGGYSVNFAYAGLGQSSETFKDFTTPGENSYSIPDGAKIPNIDSRCSASEVIKWSATDVNDTKSYTPRRYLIKVTACGAGGGGGGHYNHYGCRYGGGGGSGGYAKDIYMAVSSSPIYIKIPGGGGTGSIYTPDLKNAGFYSGSGGGGAQGNDTGGNNDTYGGKGGSGICLSGAVNGNYGGSAAGTALSYGGNGGCVTNFGCAGMGGRGSVWGGGGGGGAINANGCSSGSAGGGGGGGGPTTIATKSGTSGEILFQVGGGGGGGGGGGYGGGSGGGGGGTNTAGTMGNQGGAYLSKTINEISAFIGGHNGYLGQGGNAAWFHNGGGGGGGAGGVSGTSGINASGNMTNYGPEDVEATCIANNATPGRGGVISNSIFNKNVYCSGGGSYSAGKQGALRLYWGGGGNKFKCQYRDKTNSGAGGGAGQVWIGEISVTPGQKLNFNIGMGGNGGNSNNANISGNNHDGKNGGDTSIYAGSTKLVSVSGGKGGKYETNNTYISNSGGYGGGMIISDADGIASGNLTNYSKTNNWTGIDINTFKSMAGLNGSQGNTIANGAGGGAGGNTIKRDGTVSLGAVSVNAETNGNNALSTNYGSGGSGGGGVVNYGGIKGIGGKGANGYIYIEWGNANGGGGSTGQVVTKKKVWVTAGTKIQIKVGKGGEPKPILTTLNGVSGYFGQQGNNGGDSYVITNEGEAIRAKGGIGGYPAGTNHGLGGNSEESVSSSFADKVIPNIIKGEDGNDDYGGVGGSITEILCPLITELNGLGGCGGNMPSGHCANSSSTPIGKNAAKTGGGGGGGAVKIDSSGGAAYTGGKGADGMVTIEWNN